MLMCVKYKNSKTNAYAPTTQLKKYRFLVFKKMYDYYEFANASFLVPPKMMYKRKLLGCRF